jgi:choline dehydrogenase-like flavoprotein
VIKDLAAEGDTEVAADVLIIGGGTVGLLMAVQLAERGHLVVVAESGGREQPADTHELNEVVHTRAVYAGAAHGRFRCLGGTSTRWGGALIPFVAADCLPDEWPVAREELEPYVPVVESLFDLAPGSYEGDTVFDGPAMDFRVRMAKWPAFRRRNVATLLAKQLHTLPRLNVWLNATATEFDIAGGLLKTVTARSSDGRTLRVSARRVVIAAGAIETTRLLLLMDLQQGNTLFAPDRQLGRYFSDHISMAVADIKPRDRSALNMMTGFRFERSGSMRNVRYELADNTPLRQVIPPCFAHIAFVQEDVGGFAALRDFFRHVQRRSLPDLRLLSGLVLAMPWLLRAAWWRFVRRRLLYPASANVQLHMVIEQQPRPESCIRLSASRKDLFGQPLAEIEWAVAPDDSDNFRKAVSAFESAWNHSALAKIAELQTYSGEVLEQALAGNAGIFHPVGSVRMAKSPQHGVVDPDLRLFRLQNVAVVSTAVLPRSGGANPTMMLLLLGLRCVDSLSAALNAKI